MTASLTRKMKIKLTIGFMLAFFPVILAKCPANTTTLHRIGETRYYIIQNTEQRGEFVTIEQARQDCSKHGMKLATVKNLLSLAVVGRPLEKMAFAKRMKDTWYWLDAKYDTESEKYHWGNDLNDELKYTLILYRTPRPIGVSSHITYNNVYQKDQDKPQCLTLALPWLGSADHHPNTTVFFGHQTSFDERDCKSQKKRHAMCEASKTDCPPPESNSYVLDEGKTEYFEEGNWIFGDRKYIVNWNQKTFNDSEKYCKSLGLQLMNAGALEKFLIPHIKMWSREITVSQFWTGMSYHDKTKQYMDSSGNIITNENIENNFTESEFDSRSSKSSPIFCVALSLAYEFRSQMPCSNNASSGCQWSFIRYAPANCNNYHGTICQHQNYDQREVKWYPNFKTNLDEVLEKTALTTVFGYKGNKFVLRSKYKQTFGVCYCPKGFRMIRSHNNLNLAWSVKPLNTSGKEVHEYDFTDSYWMVDTDVFNKSINAKCKLSYTDKGTRKFKDIKCTEWYFYLCERLGKRPTRPSSFTVNKAPPMKWKEGPQPRVYPLVSLKPVTIYDQLCPCKLTNDGNEWNTVKNKCEQRLKECPSNLFNAKQCQRGGGHVFYSIGGVICHSPKQNDRCEFEKVVFASRFYRTEKAKDSKGIDYEPDQDTIPHWNLTDELWRGALLTYTPKLVPQGDLVLYKSNQMGDFSKIPSGVPKEKDACATRNFYINDDGLYEISIKYVDDIYNNLSITTKHKRAFNVLLNDMYIAREFNPNEYNPIRHGMELNVNLRVFENGKKLELQGHPSRALVGKTLKLEVCYSFCARTGYKADPNWMWSAVSIIKFGKKKPTNIYEVLCPCKLKNEGNEWDPVSNECVKRLKECPDNVFDHNHCQRGYDHVFYSIGGIICKSSRQNDKCTIERLIYASSFDDDRTTWDTNGITFEGDYLKPMKHHQRWNVPVAQWLRQYWGLVPLVYYHDTPIYFIAYSGNVSNLSSGNPTEKAGCPRLLFDIIGDGRYEISFKFYDRADVLSVENSPYKRAFSVLLNDMYIAREFNPNEYMPQKYPIDLNINFRVFENGKMIQLQGHPSKAITGNKLKLELCYSFCARIGYKADPNWFMNAVSIVKFSSKQDDPCECKIKDASKEYNTVTGQCLSKQTIYVGCYHFSLREKDVYCKRTGHMYFTHLLYAMFGTICFSAGFDQNYHESQACEIEKIIYAVNFGGQKHRDTTRNITYSKVSMSDWEIKPFAWREGNSKLNVQHVLASDVAIYKSWAAGDWAKANKTSSGALACAGLTFPTFGNGRYEITMKTGEVQSTANRNRAFSVLLNDIYIVKEFLIEKYRESPKGLELIQNFKILQNSTKLQLQNHPPKQIERSDKKLQLQFCHSNCDSRKLGFNVDRDWVMYGLSIVKFKSLSNPV